MDIGDNLLSVAVEAEDGTATSYNITVTREASGNNMLSNLTSNTGTFDPAFYPETDSYELMVGSTFENVTLT
ncbi:MAG: hypothetical protein EOP54_23295, partial [Sphingobacteriales bacterium]